MKEYEITKEFAEGCLKVVETYLNNNNEIDIVSEENELEGIKLSFKKTVFNNVYGKR